MSFKSKQRAKHGHLFGDDPLNASTTTSFDSPSIKTSRPKSPMDPLSRSSSPGGSNGSSNPSPNGSIFGGIDVSKFGSKRNLRSSTSLRPTTTLKLVDDSDGDDDDDFLFGGGRKTSTSSSLTKRKISATSAPLVAQTSPKSTTNELPTGSPRVNHSTIMAPAPLSPSIAPSPHPGAPTLHPQRLQSATPPNSSTPSPLPLSTPPRVGSPSLSDHQTSTPPKQQQQQQQPKSNNTSPVKKPPPPPPPARRSALISKAAISPLVSSSTSSLSSFSSSTSSSSPIMGHSQQPPPPPPRIHKKHQQHDLSRQTEASMYNNNNSNKVNQEEDDDEDDDDGDERTRMMQRQKAAMMEDEGTRAFAMAPSSTSSPTILSPPSSMMMNYDDPELYASVTQFHSLAITGSSSTPTNKPNVSFIPSSSNSSSISSLTPNHQNNSSNSNPWDYNITASSFLVASTMSPPFPTATTTTPLPTTTNSAAKKQQDLDKRLKEIEPAKRTAFADLIANWHNANNNNYRISGKDSGDNDNDDTHFFEHVASEQRDIGFAGIDGHPSDDDDNDGDDDGDDNGKTTRFPSSFDWQENSLMDVNPWS